MSDHMQALNRAIEKAFAHTEGDNNIDGLLACMGEELGCSRISIFEENEEGFCDNTYEWCCPDAVHERIMLQHIAIAKFDSWHDRLVNCETIVVRAPEDLQSRDPDVYRMFVEQNIHSALVTLLAYHGKNFGFCILEDPDAAVMADAKLIMPGIRYILSSMIYSRNLVGKLKRLGYIDTQTGVGNRVSLHEYLEQIDRSKSIGMVAVDVIGWDDGTDKLPYLEKEQTLMRAGEVLTNLFDSDHVFRVATGEFIIIESGLEQAAFESNMRSIRSLFREHNLLTSVAGEWHAQAPESFDGLIKAVHQKAEGEKRVIMSHSGKAASGDRAKPESEGKAVIDLPHGDTFFRIADHFLAEFFEESMLCIVSDINYFKLYNDIFGRKSGNRFLETIEDVMRAAARQYGGIAGYMGGDNFCLIVPVRGKSPREIQPFIEQFYQSLDYPEGFSPALGAYLSDDRRESAITLYDRAMGALSEIKGDYIRHIHFYSSERHRHQREDKLLLMEVKNGLANGEFIFYIQPQVYEKTGKIIGGEALVRWLHEGRLISPGRFIPILEKTGYVYTVDCHVWESVAKWQRSLIDRGIKPVPVSVNVSRVDFYFTDIAETFIRLVQKYGLPPELIGVEITESAFTDNNATILEAIEKLHAAGFHILMDDFGSGSSSLSMLHTMNLDVLKTDVQFMSKVTDNKRAVSIVESIISMAHMIGMSVVTEGVETEVQKNNLICMGENYAQGYYFYRPMPVEQFEALISDPGNVTQGYRKKAESAAGQLRFRDMIQKGLVSETLLDNIIRAAAIFKEEGDVFSILQINEQFAAMLGLSAHDGETGRFLEHLDEGCRQTFRELLRQANTHPLGGSEGMVRYLQSNDNVLDLNLRVFLLYTLDNHRLYLATVG
ncbi:MAG: EAL domain-containing protein [Clostridia bacterium]|nr:EAL domain-containing protein [Clostridia bacterium]